MEAFSIGSFFAIIWRVAALVGLEVAFNVYPAQGWSSLLLQASHIAILVAIFSSPIPPMYVSIWEGTSVHKANHQLELERNADALKKLS